MTTVAGAPVPMDVLADPRACLAAWERWIDRTGLSPATKRTYAGEVRAFVLWIGQQDKHRPDEVFTDPNTRNYAVKDYRRHLLGERRRAPKGVDTAMTSLSSIYRWCGLGPAAVPAAARRRTAPKSLTADNMRDVLRAAERRGVRDLALVGFAFGTGLRVAELNALDLDDVWVSERKGAVQVRLGKGEQPRTVALNSQVRLLLGPWLAQRARWGVDEGERALFVTQAGQRMAVRTMRHSISEVGRAAGLPVAPHTLRHTFARLQIDAGVDIVSLADQMGHRDVNTTRVYSRPTPQNLEAAVENLVIEF